MLNIIKVILFVIVNVAGWFTIQVLAVIAMKYGFFPQLPAGHHTETLKFWYMAVGLWVWMASAAASVGYFFAGDDKKNWLLLAPMYVTAAYCLCTLIYFNFIYTIS